MNYARIENGAIAAYPYTLAQLRADNPDVSFPRELSRIRIEEYGVVPVASAPVPNPSSISVDVVEGAPALVEGVWTQTWAEAPASAETIARRTKDAEDEAIQAHARADAFVQQFVSMTPGQVAAYVDANVTSLASAKTLLTKLAVMMLLMARREFGQ